MVTVVESESSVAAGRTATVVVEGESIDDVSDMQAREAALSWAAGKGLSRPGISSPGGPYPVDADGKTINTVATAGKVRYRNDYQVTAGI